MVQTGHGKPEIIACANGNCLSVKCAQIGDWDMDSNATKAVAHGLTLSTIRLVSAIIRNDADDTRYQIVGHDGGTIPAQIDTIDATNVNLSRKGGAIFDSVDFDSTSYNRGYVFIWFSN